MHIDMYFDMYFDMYVQTYFIKHMSAKQKQASCSS